MDSTAIFESKSLEESDETRPPGEPQLGTLQAQSSGDSAPGNNLESTIPTDSEIQESSYIRQPMPLPLPQFLPPLAPIWSVHSLTDGRMYYFNRLTQESIWERPHDFHALAPITPLPGHHHHQQQQQQHAGSLDSPFPLVQPPQQPNAEALRKEKEREAAASAARPISSRPIPGKPWHVVFTGNGKVFFFNKTTRVSVWEVPTELADVSNLEKLMRPPREGESDDDDEEDDGEDYLRDGEEEEQEKEKEKELTIDALEPEAKKAKLDDDDDDNNDDDEEEERETAEAKASRLRKSLSVEERLELVYQMLSESNVSAFSAFEKELPKFVSDYRYLLLPMKERRNAFDSFVAKQVEEERKEKSRKIREKREEFQKLLEEARLGPKSTFTDFSAKYGRHDRYKAVDKMKERETLFHEFVAQLKARLKEEDVVKEEKVREDFFAMLAEVKKLNKKSEWRRVKDSLYKDKRYRAVSGSEKREALFKEYVSKLAGDSGQDVDRERKEKMEASLRERQKEVERERENQAHRWGREREMHRKEETLERFKAFLIDMVKDSEMGWRDARHSLRKDHRWRDFDLLDFGEKEDFFHKHVANLRSRKRNAFHRLLDETKVSLTSTWKEVKGSIKKDPRFEKFSSSDTKRKMEFERYMEEQHRKAKEEFRSLLRETKQISHRTKQMIEDNPTHLKEIKQILMNDLRWLVLDFVEDERESLLLDYVDGLANRGPPPPPTASDPSETRRKRTI